MSDHIQIHHLDTEEEAKARHAKIEARLDELGADEVRFLQSNGKLPTNWDPIIAAWMRGERQVAKAETPGDLNDGIA